MGFKKGHTINAGRIWTDEAREKLRQANLGKVISIDNLEKLRQTNLGNKYNLGRYPSDETKLKMRLAHLGNKTNLGSKHSEETKLKMSLARIGFEFSEESKAKMSLSASGEKNPNWKGGKRKNTKGYITVKIPNHPLANTRGYVMEHRLVMEQALGRYLLPEEIIHHINETRDDNRLENLMLFENKVKHIKFHKQQRDLLKVG